MTNWRKRDGCLALSAVLALLVVEVLSLRGVLPNGLGIEIICNIVMLAIAVIGLFFLGHPPENKPASCVLGNMAVSLMATIMNIDVFGHDIRLEHLVDDLLSWHFLWISFSILQLLVLSSLGKLLLKQIREILKWGKDFVVIIGKIILDIAKFIKECQKSTCLTVIVGILLWVGYWGIQIFVVDVQTVLSGADFWQKSLLLWIIYLVITVLIYLLPIVWQKSKEALQKIDAKNVLAGTACVGAILILPLILKLVAALVGFLLAIVEKAIKKDEDKNEDTDEKELINPNENRDSAQNSIRRVDAAVVLIFFLVIPFSMVFFTTLATPEGWEHFSEMISEATALLEFENEFMDVMNNFLDMFRLN